MLIGRSSRTRLRQRGPVGPSELDAVPVQRRNLDSARSLVAGHSITGIHVASMLSRPLTGRRAHRGLWLFSDRARPIAVAQHSRGISFVVDPQRREDGHVVPALTQFVSRAVVVSEVLFGDESLIRSILDAGRQRGLAAPEIRRQELMAAGLLVSPPGSPPVDGFRLRAARADDLPWLLSAHAAMCREDLGVDQVTRNRDGYDEYFTGLIAQDRSRIGELDGSPVFKAEYPVESADARLIEGVYTLPRVRGRGLASWAMRHAIVDAAREGKKACLYVHLHNATARRIYRRVGFRVVSPWLTAVVSRERRVAGRPVEL
ncbi:MAG: GNAT family N-acetyltransferase [Acidobacteriota bacterium]|nr:GNAT family N-acetyltransferase [Acidobacteriota bacterium]